MDQAVPGFPDFLIFIFLFFRFSSGFSGTFLQGCLELPAGGGHFLRFGGVLRFFRFIFPGTAVRIQDAEGAYHVFLGNQSGNGSHGGFPFTPAQRLEDRRGHIADGGQHLEIARTIANRFNGIYGDTFTLPAGYVPKAGAKIMSLAEPTKKMSKSDTNANAFVLMTDDKDTIVRKFKRAVTDSDGVVRFDAENKPGVSNLMTIYSTFTGKDLAAIEAEFAGKGYGDFKLAVAEVTADALAPVQAEYGRILADKAYVDSVLKSGAERAARLANRTVSKVYRKVGLMQLDK